MPKYIAAAAQHKQRKISMTMEATKLSRARSHRTERISVNKIDSMEIDHIARLAGAGISPYVERISVNVLDMVPRITTAAMISAILIVPIIHISTLAMVFGPANCGAGW